MIISDFLSLLDQGLFIRGLFDSWWAFIGVFGRIREVCMEIEDEVPLKVFTLHVAENPLSDEVARGNFHGAHLGIGRRKISPADSDSPI